MLLAADEATAEDAVAATETELDSELEPVAARPACPSTEPDAVPATAAEDAELAADAVAASMEPDSGRESEAGFWAEPLDLTLDFGMAGPFNAAALGLGDAPAEAAGAPAEAAVAPLPAAGELDPLPLPLPLPASEDAEPSSRLHEGVEMFSRCVQASARKAARTSCQHNISAPHQANGKQTHRQASRRA
jgi:hypothetical protein